MATLTPLGPSASITAWVSTARTTWLTIDEPAAAGEALPEAVSLRVRMPGLEDEHNGWIGGFIDGRGDCFRGGLASFHPVGEYAIGELTWSARMSIAEPTGISSPSTSTTLNDPACKVSLIPSTPGVTHRMLLGQAQSLAIPLQPLYLCSELFDLFRL
jgi:hypothetical protein